MKLSDFGAHPGASPATNATAIQDAFDWVLAEGGELEAEPRMIYQVGERLSCVNTDQLCAQYYRKIDLKGATLDFSQSGITSGALLSIGAGSMASTSETASSFLKNAIVKGPETDSILPRTSSHQSDAQPATTTEGVYLDTAHNWHLRHVYVTNVYKGFHYQRTWWNQHHSIRANKCLIGHHVDASVTYATWTNAQASFCTFPFLLRPTVIAAAISNNAFLAPIAEQCSTFMHLDQNSQSGCEIQGVHVINPSMEDIYYDAFRVGIEWYGDPANAGLRGPALAGKISSLVVDGGTFHGDGVYPGYGVNRKAFYFGANGNCASGRLLFPCATADIANLPAGVTFQRLKRAEEL